MQAELATLETGKESPAGGPERVFKKLREMLLSGELKPGDRLPPERELAQMLGVGRPLLREVTRSMAMLGLLDVKQGSGTFVGRANIEMISGFLGFCLAQEQSVLDDVMNARMAIERQAVTLACERATDADFQRLGACMDALVATIDDPEAGAEADYDFHRAIIAASRSASLIALYGSMGELIRRSHAERRRTTYKAREVVGDLVEAHREVFLSLLARDPAVADTKILAHFAIGDQLRRRSMMDTWGRDHRERDAS